MLQIKTLGQLAIILNGRILSFKMNKAAVLLAYLAYQPGQVHNRDQLATLFWADETERKARENLRQAVYQLRRGLGQETAVFCHISRATIQFHPDSPYQLDVTQFQAKMAAQQWEAAAELYQGDFLHSFGDSQSVLLDEWIIIQRERLHQMATQALLQAAQQASSRGAANQARRYATRLLQLEPWNEAAHRQLMRYWSQQDQRNKALAQYQQCVDVLATHLNTLPTAETTALYTQIRDGQVTAVTPPTPPHNLPTPLTPLVGRDEELAHLQQQISQPTCRLLTIIAPGGMGKTRLLQALGWASLPTGHFPDGIFYISLLDLAPVVEEDQSAEITSLILQQLPFALSESSDMTSHDRLQKTVHDRRLLLLIDNWEPYLNSVTLLPQLLMAAPQLTIAATSREPLQLLGEWLFELHGLDLPPAQTNAPINFGAAELFLQVARRLHKDFQPDPEQWQQIYTICRVLEGHPLAIEMAAGWLRGLTLAELVEQVAAGLDVLTTTAPGIAARHQNMRHLLEYSWQRLTPDQQQMLAQLSLFRQPFTRQMAQAITAVSVMALSTLVLRTWLHRLGDGRYQYHELLRHFAYEKLLADPNLYHQTQRRYIEAHLSYLQQQYDHIAQAQHRSQLTPLYQQRVNLEQAYRWTIAAGRQSPELFTLLTKATAAMGLFYRGLGLLTEGVLFFEQCIEQLRPLLTPNPSPAARRAAAKLLIAQANLRNAQVRSKPVPAMMQEAAQWAQPADDEPLNLAVQIEHGTALLRLGQFAEAETRLQDALHLAQRLDDTASLINIHGQLGNWAADNSRPAEALPHYETAYAYSIQAPEPLRDAHIRHDLALNLGDLGQYDRARRLLQENVALWWARQDLLGLAMACEGLGYLSLVQGQMRLAPLHLRRALRLYDQLADEDGLGYTHLYLGHLAVAERRLAAAASHYRETVRLRQQMGHTYLLPSGWVGLANVAWQQGKRAEAVHYVARALPALLAGTVQGEDSMRAYWTAYCLLVDLDDGRATAVLQQAITRLRTQADRLPPDTAVRQAFLQGVAVNRQLLQAAQAH